MEKAPSATGSWSFTRGRCKNRSESTGFSRGWPEWWIFGLTVRFFSIFSSPHLHTRLGRTDAEHLLDLGPNNLRRTCATSRSVPSATSIPSSPFQIPNVSISPKENTRRSLVGPPLTCAIHSGHNGGRGDLPSIDSAWGWTAWVITTPGSSFPSILISSDSRRLQ